MIDIYLVFAISTSTTLIQSKKHVSLKLCYNHSCYNVTSIKLATRKSTHHCMSLNVGV